MTKKEMIQELIKLGAVDTDKDFSEIHPQTLKAMLRKAGVMGSLVVDTDEVKDEVKPASFYHMQFEHRSGNWGDVVTFRKEEDGNWICVGTATGRLKWMA